MPVSQTRNTRHHAPLHPQHTAGALHSLCQAIPVWPHGAVGAANALRLVTTAMQEPHTAAAGHALALFAWAQAPFDTQLLHIVRHLYTQHPSLTFPDAVLTKARAQAQALVDASPASVETLTALRHLADLLPPLGTSLASPQTRAHNQGTASPSTAVPPAHVTHPWSLWCSTALAQYHCLHGDITAAREVLWPVWTHCPYHPNLILALYELLFNQLDISQPVQNPPVLLLYSWNKAEVLAQSLASLRASHTDNAPVFVLNNGSNDDTASLLRAAADNWGEQLHCLHLPVNIGAPAARNWLLAQPEVRQYDNVIFLDDDILLEKSWLRTLCAVADMHPEADTIGCRITGHVPPHTVQCADFFLLPPEGGDTSFVDMDEHMHLHCAAMGSVDHLLTRYTRPCLSVSGCCHLLRMRHVAEHGGFDIRFSPSQFDDAERDLRTVLHGGQVVYTGQVSVKHVQHSSLQQAHNRARAAHIFGNKLKLEFLYEAKKAATIRHNLAPHVLQDLVRKCTRLASLTAPSAAASTAPIVGPILTKDQS